MFFAGRRNRSKQQQQQKENNYHIAATMAANNNHHNSSKDNHNNNNNNRQQSPDNNNAKPETHHLTNSSNSSSSYTPICGSCLRLEAEVKRFKLEAGQFKQLENELRQKTDACATAKSNLTAKNKEFDELNKKYVTNHFRTNFFLLTIPFPFCRNQEMICNRQADRQIILSIERRVTEERRLRDSLATQLNAERKQRKQAEEKATR